MGCLAARRADCSTACAAASASAWAVRSSSSSLRSSACFARSMTCVQRHMSIGRSGVTSVHAVCATCRTIPYHACQLSLPDPFYQEEQERIAVCTGLLAGQPAGFAWVGVAHLGAHGRAICPLLRVCFIGLLPHAIKVEVCQPLTCCTDAVCPSSGVKACPVEIFCLGFTENM